HNIVGSSDARPHYVVPESAHSPLPSLSLCGESVGHHQVRPTAHASHTRRTLSAQSPHTCPTPSTHSPYTDHTLFRLGRGSGRRRGASPRGLGPARPHPPLPAPHPPPRPPRAPPVLSALT